MTEPVWIAPHASVPSSPSISSSTAPPETPPTPALQPTTPLQRQFDNLPQLAHLENLQLDSSSGEITLLKNNSRDGSVDRDQSNSGGGGNSRGSNSNSSNNFNSSGRGSGSNERASTTTIATGSPPSHSRNESTNDWQSVARLLTHTPRGSKVFSQPTVLKEGWLSKRGAIRTGWKTRYFVCLPHKVQYFKTAKYADLVPLGEIMLTPHTVVGVDKTATKNTSKQILSIMSVQGSRRFLLECKDEQEMKDWLDVLLTRVSDLIKNQSDIDTAREQGLAKLSLYGRSVACREVYDLIHMMQAVAPFSAGCDQLWNLARRLEEEVAEDLGLSLILMQLYAIFQLRKAGPNVRALDCRCDRGKHRCPIVVLKAFAFNNGSDILLRLWMHLIAPSKKENIDTTTTAITATAAVERGGSVMGESFPSSGPSLVSMPSSTPSLFSSPSVLMNTTTGGGDEEENTGHPTPEWIIRVLWVISELEGQDLFSKCPSDLLIDVATKIHVEDVIESREKQSLFTIRVNVGHQVWYVERQFAELRNFADELGKTFKENKYVKAFPPSKLGPVDRAINIKRLHGLNEYFQVLQGRDSWPTAVALPAFIKFFDITSYLRLSRHGENTWSKFVKAVQVGAQIGQSSVMARTAVTLFEILLGLLPSPREDKVKTWDIEQISRFCMTSPPIVVANVQSLILRVLLRCSLQFTVCALECMHLLVGSGENCHKLTHTDERWPTWFLPFLSEAYIPPRLPATQQCRNAAVGFHGTVRVEIAIKCRNLIQMDALSLSDPVVEMYLRNKEGKLYMQPGNERTEVIDNNHNPNFLTRFFVDYNPLLIPRQELTFIVYDSDGPTLRREDRMGLVVANLHDLLIGRITQHQLQLLYFGPTITMTKPEDENNSVEREMGGTSVAKELTRLMSSRSLEQSEEEKKSPDLLTRMTSYFYQDPPTMIIYAKPVEDHTLRVLLPNEMTVAEREVRPRLPNLVLGNEEKLLCFAANSKDFEDQKHVVVLTSRRLLIFVQETITAEIWRDDVALVRLYLNGAQLDLATWTGETHVISLYHKAVAAFLMRVFQMDRTSAIVMREAQPGQPLLATVADLVEEGHAAPRAEWTGTLEEKAKKEKLRAGLSLSVFAQVMYHYFTTTTAARKKSGSYCLRLFGIVNTIADEMAWNQSAFVPVVLRFLYAVVALMQSRYKGFLHKYEAVEWPNVFRMCGAYEKLINYRPISTGNPSRLSKQRRRVARNHGVPILDANGIKLVATYLDSLRFEEMDPTVASFAGQLEKMHVIYLKHKGLKEVSRWSKKLAKLSLPTEEFNFEARTRERRQNQARLTTALPRPTNTKTPLSASHKNDNDGDASTRSLVDGEDDHASDASLQIANLGREESVDGHESSDFDEEEPQEDERAPSSVSLQVSASDF